MKKAVLFSVLGTLGAWGTVAAAEEVGRVISSTPVIQQVAVARQVCNNQPMAVQQPSSGAGAAVGMIAGGLLGNTIGHGSGRAAATLIGALGGAAVGNNIEGGSGNYVQNVPQCSTQTSYENRTVAYNVVYEYGGKEFSVQMPYDPGSAIRLQVTPVAANAPSSFEGSYANNPNPAPPGTAVGVIVGQPVAPTPAYPAAYPAHPGAYPGYPGAYPAYPAAYPAYPAYYYPRPYFYPPIGLSLGFNFSGGHRHHRR